MKRFFEIEPQQKKRTPQYSSLMKKIIKKTEFFAEQGTVPEKNMLSFIDPTEIEIVEGSENIYNLIVNKIKGAKKQILIQAFVWIPNTQVVKDIRSALCELKNDVEVFLLVDQLDWIARIFFLGEFPPQQPLHDPESLGLGSLPNNIKLHIGTYVHNSYASNHNKAIWIDGDVILTGANLQPENYGPNGFHDAAMFIPKGLADSAFYDFKSMWDIRTNQFEEDITPIKGEKCLSQFENSCPILYVTNTIRLWPAVLPFYRASLPLDPLSVTYLEAINEAKKIIRIAVPNLNSPEIIQALVNFINNKNGQVELLMGKEFNEFREKMYGGTNQNSVEQLFSMVDEDKQVNLQIRWFNRGKQKFKDSVPDVIHMKFMAVDEQVIIYGSANLDLVCLHNCHETNIVIDDAQFTARATHKLFAPLFNQGIAVEIENKWNCAVM